MNVDLYNMDCRTVLDLIVPDNSIDSIVTDPPYGLEFMGKEWDRGVPGVEFWQYAINALKPGGYLLAFGGTRTFHRMTCAIEDAGFEIRDCVMWVYGSGFPKSHNGPWGGTALKPAWEPIIMARKPLVGTVEANWLAHGVGALNIDGCRVAPVGEGDYSYAPGVKYEGRARQSGFALSAGKLSDIGRWPANLIHDGSDEVLAAFPQAQGQQGATGKRTQGAVYGAVDSGVAGVAPRADTGSAARFFYCAKASTADRDEGLEDAPDRILAMRNQAKAELARGNMHKSLDGMNTAKTRKNNHPTVKPTDLMAYLCRLVTPPGGTVLDPFMGSGSTGKACMREGFNFIGCELSPEYHAVAQARIAAARGWKEAA